MSISETLEPFGDLNANVPDDQLLGGDNADFLKHEYLKDGSNHQSLDSGIVDDFDFPGYAADPDSQQMLSGDVQQHSDYLQPKTELHSSSYQSLNQLQAMPGEMTPVQEEGTDPFTYQHSTQNNDQQGHLQDDSHQQNPRFSVSPTHENRHTSQVFMNPASGTMNGHRRSLSSHEYMHQQDPAHHLGGSDGLTMPSLTLANIQQPQQQRHISTEPAQMQQVQKQGSPQKPAPPFKIDLPMVRRTMEGVNRALGVDLGGTEVGETALMDNPLSSDVNEDSELKDGSSTKAEMSHVRLISDACGHIVASVGRAVLVAAEESRKENAMAGLHGQRPKPPIRKKRGGILGFKELAQRANLSPWHFHRVFRFVTGVTPKAYGEALWEFLMMEAGFDLDNEELTINLAFATRGPAAGSAAANSITTSSSNSSSPSSPGSATQVSSQSGNIYKKSPNSVDGNSATSLSSTKTLTESKNGVSAAPVMPMNGTGSSVSAGTGINTHKSATDLPTLTSHPQPNVPLTGPIAPGRVRKTSSSRGARSRSRNRAQPPGQVLSGFGIEPGSAEAAAAAPLHRGRSFGRVAQRPVLVTTDQALQGNLPNSHSIQSPPTSASGISPQHMIGQPTRIGAHSRSPPPMGPSMSASTVPMPTQGPKQTMQSYSEGMVSGGAGAAQNHIPDSSMHQDLLDPDMMMRQQRIPPHQSPYSAGGYGFDVPDLNGLTLQPEPPASGIDASHQPSSVPSISPLTSGQYLQLYPQSESIPAAPYQRGSFAKGHNRRQSTGMMKQQHPGPLHHQHHYSSYAVPQQPLPSGYPGNLGSIDPDTHSTQEGVSMLNRDPGSATNLSNHQGLYDQQGMLSQSGENHNTDHDRSIPPSGINDSLQDYLQREMMFDERNNEEAKNDQLSDLPASFYLSMDDKSLYGEDSHLGLDDYSSALIGMDDPPLMPSWNEADTSDQFSY